MALFSDSESKGGGNFLTKDMGPLPVWGWLVVGGVAFYLFKQTSGKNTAAQQAQVPTGMTPNVFFLPDQATGTVGTPAPGSTQPWGGASGAALAAIGQAQNQAAGPAGLQQAVQNPDTAALFNSLNQMPASQAQALENFFNANAIAKQEGLPYYTSQGLYNPATGVTTPVTS